MNESLSINKNIQSSTRNLLQYSPYRECLLSGKSIALLPWPNGTQGHSGRQHPSSVWGVSRLPAKYSLKRLIPHTTARHPFSLIGYLASRLNFLLAVANWAQIAFILLHHYSCYSMSSE